MAMAACATLNGSLYRLVKNTTEFAAASAVSRNTDCNLNYDI